MSSGSCCGVTLESLEQTEDCARRVQAQGARNVLVSMADKGALLLDEEGRLHRGIPPRGEAVSAVGQGFHGRGVLGRIRADGGLRVGAGTGDRGGERYRLLSLAGRQTRTSAPCSTGRKPMVYRKRMLS